MSQLPSPGTRLRIYEILSLSFKPDPHRLRPQILGDIINLILKQARKFGRMFKKE